MDGEKDKLSVVLIQLLKGVLYQEMHPAIWQDLIQLEARVSEFLGLLGLRVLIDEQEGFAYLRQKPIEEGVEPLPRMVQRRPMSFHVSLLCVLLRKRMMESDSRGDEVRVVLTRSEMIDMMRIFLKDQTNDVKLVDKINAQINKVIELGFLRKMKTKSEDSEQTFEVRRIIKSLVDADWLAGLDEKLKTYKEHALGNT